MREYSTEDRFMRYGIGLVSISGSLYLWALFGDLVSSWFR